MEVIIGSFKEEKLKEYRELVDIIESVMNFEENYIKYDIIEESNTVLHIKFKNLAGYFFDIYLNSEGKSKVGTFQLYLPVDFIDRMRYKLKVWRLQNE